VPKVGSLLLPMEGHCFDTQTYMLIDVLAMLNALGVLAV